MGFFQGTEERVRNSRGRRAISVRATEVLLYLPRFVHLNKEIIHKLDRVGYLPYRRTNLR